MILALAGCAVEGGRDARLASDGNACIAKRFDYFPDTDTLKRFIRGGKAYDREDYETALQSWKPLAEQGNAAAQTALGHLHAEGLGVEQDSREAVA